jgi:hypothetical protein
MIRLPQSQPEKAGVTGFIVLCCNVASIKQNPPEGVVFRFGDWLMQPAGAGESVDMFR